MEQAFASLAQIRILLLPVGSIQRALFGNWAAELDEFNEIRLSDVPADSRDDRARFMPSPLASGSLFLSFTRHPPPSYRSRLDLFRPSDFPLGVVGIASCSESDALSSIYSQFNGSLAELFPSSSMFPLAQNCFVFEEGDGNTNLNIGNHLPGLVVIPSMMGNKKLYVGTLLAELCSNILGEFSVIVKALESQSGSESLNAGLFARLPDYRNPRSTPDRHEDYRSSQEITALHSLPDTSRSDPAFRSNDHSRFNLKRASTLGPGTVGNTGRNSQLLAPSPKKRQSAVGAGTTHARLYKVLGDLFLLAGRTMDAIIWYNEAVHHLKQSQDAPWQAAALEGMAVAGAIESWTAAAHGPSSANSDAKESWGDHSDKLSRAITLYSGAADIADNEGCMSDLSFLYVTACLRHSSLLHSLWLSKGWSTFTFSALLCGETLTRSSADVSGAGDSISHTGYLNTVAGISRSDISAILAQAHGPWLLHLGFRERIEALRCVAGVYSSLRYKRKEAYILRELLACLMDLVIHGREEAMDPSEPMPDIHSANLIDVHGSIGIRERDNVAGNASILRLVKHICEVHGIYLNSVGFIGDEGSNTARQSYPSSGAHYTDQVYRRTPLTQYVWPDLQVGMVREALAIAETLPDYPAVASFALSALRSLHSRLEPEDQFHFFTASARAMTTVRRRGDERKLEYWPAEVVASIKFMPLPFVRLPTERPWSDLHVQSEEGNEQLVRVDPLLYNQRRITNNKRQVIAVANELLEFVVTLENPYSVALDVLQISLSTGGVPFISNPLPVEIRPNSYETIVLSGRATEAGTLVIRGCILELSGVEPHETLIPVFPQEEEEKGFLRAVADYNESERFKSKSLNDKLDEMHKQSNTVPSGKENKSIPSPKYLELKVVSEQPYLRIRRTSLTNGAVMLYDGETSTIRLVVENISALPIDFLGLSFDDSAQTYFEQALNEGDLNAFETYETEYNLVHRPVFSYEPDMSRKEILPGKECTISVKCFGRAGCTDGTIQLSYSYAHRRQESLQAPPSVFYARQLLFPVLVTVYQMLECSGMNILPISTGRAYDDPAESEGRRALLEGLDDLEWCVLTLDVQNTYGLPFEVTLSHNLEVSTSRVVPPGSTYKFLLPIRRFALPSSLTASPIPSLTNRQFVVTGLANDEDNAQRELFWHREELLKRVHATWKEIAGSRTGDLSLRQQRFTQPMLNSLRTEDIQVRLSLGEQAEKDIKGATNETGRSCLTSPNQHVLVTARVQNLSATSRVLSLTISIEPAECVVYNGVLKNIPLGRLADGGSVDHQFVVIFVAQGQFTISAQAQSVTVGQGTDVCGTGRLVVIAQDA
ncbi:hypothetical protein M0805_006829 [Coniferiporia weirii]|nr:hypothetical protein M0805_006829 [Coniferiporia weirii]